MEFTKHFNQMLEERTILMEWVQRTLQIPDHIENYEDGTRHFIKQIPEHENRWLRVVMNVSGNPNRAITAFFDRRLRKTRI
jgi:sporulation-control protein spo0M